MVIACELFLLHVLECGIAYIDFFEVKDLAGIDGMTDFQDEGHLNINGSRKIARYLGQYLADHYELTDMRTVEGNPWELNSSQKQSSR